MSPSDRERIAAMEAKCEERTKTFESLADSVKELNGRLRCLVIKVHGAWMVVWVITVIAIATQSTWSKWFK